MFFPGRAWVRAGLTAAVLSGVPSTVMTLGQGEDIFASTEAVGAVLLPRGSTGWARVAAGSVVHVLLSLFWARLIQRVVGRDTARVVGAAAGAACGAGIALVDLGLVGRFLPSIRALAGGPLLADHVAYGAIVGWMLSRSADQG